MSALSESRRRLPTGNRALAIILVGFAVLVVLASSGKQHQGRYLVQLFFASLDSGPVAALSGVGLVLTYRATGVFNFAQGGIATAAAYLYYELAVRVGLPNVVAAVIGIGVLCPMIGLSLERFVFRSLERRGAATSEKLVANLGALVLLIAVPTVIFGQTVQSDARQLFPGGAFSIFGAHVAFQGATLSWSAAGNVISLLIVAAGLVGLFRFTRLGLHLRAVVDRRALAELSAINVNRVAASAWVLGCTFAGLVGVLYAPVRGLSPYGVTLTVLETIAVAVIARLRSIPAAVVGGLLIGMVQSYLQVFESPAWPHVLTWLQPPGLPDSISVNVLVITLAALLVIFRDLDEVGTTGSSTSLVTLEMGSGRRAASLAAALAAAGALALPLLLSANSTNTFTRIVGYAIAFLGIVAITGFSGHISLATAAFAGLGAYFTTRLSNGYLPYVPFLPTPDHPVLPHIPVVLATLLAGLLVVPLGVIVGFPALRRKGLILALITLAFAQLADRFVFNDEQATAHGIRPVQRPHLLSLDLTGNTAFAYYALAVLGLCLTLTHNLRSGALGRALVAIRDSENGAVSVGISLRRYKLYIFGASSFLAAVGGAIIAQSTQSLAFEDQTFSPLYGLFWFTAVVVAGLSYPSAAVIAAVLFVGLDKVIGQQGAGTFILGLLALAVGFLPGGIVGQLSRLARREPADAARSLLTRGLRAAYAESVAEQQFRRALAMGDRTAIDPRTDKPPPSYVASPHALRLLARRQAP